MKALTLTQPWATLVAIGAKRIETRSWSTSYRGLIAIHAAKGFPAEARQLCYEPPFVGILEAAGFRLPSDLPVAQIIATAHVMNCYRFDERSESIVRSGRVPQLTAPSEADFGDFAPGRFGFLLADVHRLPEPVAARGMLNLWNIPADVAARVTAQLSKVGE